jgi:hypothetical protein
MCERLKAPLRAISFSFSFLETKNERERERERGAAEDENWVLSAAWNYFVES